MQALNRSSYPAADNPALLLETMQFLKRTPVPILFTQLTHKLFDRFPILYDIRSKFHLTSDHFRLLLMMRLIAAEKKPISWYTGSFASFLQSCIDFPPENLMEELHDMMKEMKSHEECETYVPSDTGSQFLEYVETDERESRIRYFAHFFFLKPPYFRYAIQHHDSLNLHEYTRKELQEMLYGICQRGFRDFAFDDVTRLIGWSTYFGNIRQRGDPADRSDTYSFNPECTAQYVIETLLRVINEQSKKRSSFIWKDLKESILTDFIFEKVSFLLPEELIEVILDHNRGKFRWRHVERGTGRYPGFKRDPAKQMLEILEPLIYEFSSKDLLRVITVRT